MSTVETIRSTHQVAIDAIWRSWGDLTRFHLSSRIAMQREHDIWRSIQAHSSKEIEISLPPGAAAVTYKVKLQEHLEAIESPSILAGLVLVQSWSLAESLARIGLGRDDLATVEDWGQELVAQNFQALSKLEAGRGGLVESYVVRNSVAHGLPRWTSRTANRVTKAGGSRHKPGEIVDLGDAELQRYRASVRGLMRLSGLWQTGYRGP